MLNRERRELTELFEKRDTLAHDLADELADTFIYLKKIGDHFGIDLIDAALAKMKKNALKYPAAQNRGRIQKRR